MTAQISRIRQKVELANQEDAVDNIRVKFENLIKLIDVGVTGSSRKTCIDLLAHQLNRKSKRSA